MKRREFLRKTGLGTALLLSGWSLRAAALNASSGRRVVRLKRYPGRLRPLGNINTVAEWLG